MVYVALAHHQSIALLENLDHLIAMTFAASQQIEYDDVQQAFSELSLPIAQLQNAPRNSSGLDLSRFSVVDSRVHATMSAACISRM